LLFIISNHSGLPSVKEGLCLICKWGEFAGAMRVCYVDYWVATLLDFFFGAAYEYYGT
jgi:hypothetical protein